MKGLILAGGNGSRLSPSTICVNKQLLPVYDKPMIYYPLSTLIGIGIRDICLITSPEYLINYKKLLKDGSHLGLNIEYRTQEKANGVADAFLIAEDYIAGDDVVLILGDNIFHGIGKVKFDDKGSTVFAYKVANPDRYGVVEFNSNDEVVCIEEKPANPKSDFAIVGLYYFDNRVCEFAKTLTPSKRGELEITDLMKIYLQNKQLNVFKLPKGSAWLDAGTNESLFQSAAYIQSIQARQGGSIGCIEQECYRKKFINKSQLLEIINGLPDNEYKNNLKNIL